MREHLNLQINLSQVAVCDRRIKGLLIDGLDDSSYLESLASRDFRLIKKLLHCDDDCLRSIQHLVTHLNPRPGPIFSAAVACYTIPDVIVTKIGGAWVASLNPEAMPRPRINRFYASILKQSHDDSAQRPVSQLHKAKWLIKNVRQCFDTILRVSCAIVGRQRQFFEHGQSPCVR